MDLKPLAAQKNLKNLYCNTVVIDEVTPLQGLNHLKVVNIRYTAVSSLSFLKNNPNIESHYVNGTNVSDFVKYICLPELLDELSLAKLAVDGSYRKLIKKYTKVDLLILDEWLLTDLSTDEAAILLEITESRHKAASTIFCSQIDPSGWHIKLGNETIAEAILDRIIHDSY